MTVTVRVPTQLRGLTFGQATLAVAGNTVREVLDALEARHPGMRERLFDARGLHRFVNVYVGAEDIRSLDGLDTVLVGGEELSIVPAIAGG